jgi:hypothetical protein
MARTSRSLTLSSSEESESEGSEDGVSDTEPEIRNGRLLDEEFIL